MAWLNISRSARRFRESEDGSVVAETVIWLPLLFGIFVMIADASVIFMNQARIKRILQDGHRHMATGLIDDCAGLESWVSRRVTNMAPNAAVNCVELAANSRLQVVTSAGELDLTGITGMFSSLNLTVTTVYHQEVG